MRTLTPNRRDRRRAILSLAGSLLAHAVAYAGVMAWVDWLAWAENPTFVGRRNAVLIQATWSVEQSVEPERVEIAAATPVEVLPTAAKVEHNRLTVVHTQTRPVPQVEAPTIVAIAAPASDAPQRREPASEMAEPSQPSDAARPPRQTAAAPPRSSASVAALPQEVGVDPDEPPSFAGNRPPNYPLVAQQRRWEGTVLLRLAIDAAGVVADVTVERTSGYPVLDAEAIAAVRTWRGSPARRAGRPVATEELLPVRFRLR